MLVVNAPKVTSTNTHTAETTAKAASPGLNPGVREGWESVGVGSMGRV